MWTRVPARLTFRRGECQSECRGNEVERAGAVAYNTDSLDTDLA
jgi:hypothetical protein